jgi:hypothetical protein
MSFASPTLKLMLRQTFEVRTTRVEKHWPLWPKLFHASPISLINDSRLKNFADCSRSFVSTGPFQVSSFITQAMNSSNPTERLALFVGFVR